jgi:Tfp pilus assembly protein PilV
MRSLIRILRVRRARKRPGIAKSRGRSQAGFSILEVLFAGAVLVVGFMGLMALILTAIATNNRNRMDSTGMMLASAVIEQVNSTMVGAGSAQLQDCAGTTWTINTQGQPAPGKGAALSGANIDYSESSPPANYHMDFVIAGGGTGLCSGEVQITYDVRWNIQTLPSPASTYLVTVGAKPKSAGSTQMGGKFFALPVTLRTYVGP